MSATAKKKEIGDACFDHATDGSEPPMFPITTITHSTSKNIAD